VRSQIHFLELVYPPISNQEADWLWEDPEVRSEVARSKLYMIGQRQEVFYNAYSVDPDSYAIKFDLVSQGGKLSNVILPLEPNGINGEVEIEIGDKLIRIWHAKDHSSRGELLEWLTVDKLLFDYWRGDIHVQGLENFRQFTNFKLYYVGISKEGDSFSRLFANGHKNRAKILSNESQFSQKARLTDELYIFLFDIDPLIITTLTGDSDEAIEDFLFPKPIPKLRLVADAEKAFVKIMQTKYNKLKYGQYPQSSDGLYKSGLTRWVFTINEAITFETDDISMTFGRWMVDPKNPNNTDFIYVDGENVYLGRSDGRIFSID
jgi:hypothetical protein